MKEITEWLFAKDRKEGDVKEFGKEGADIIRVRFNYRDTYDYAPVNAYVFTITAEAAASAAKESGKTDREIIEDVASRISADMTVDEFTKIATEFKTTASEKAMDKNQYPDEVNAYLFDSSRKEGDSAVISTADLVYVVRYVSTEEHTCRFNIISNRSFEEMYNKLISNNKIQIVDSMMKYANTDFTVNGN